MPDPSLVVTAPPPLNSPVFPYAVDPFPGADLRDFAAVIPAVATGPELARAADPHRYQD